MSTTLDIIFYGSKGLTEHFVRIEAAINRFNIRNPKYVFNANQCGALFQKTNGRYLREKIGRFGSRPVQRALITKRYLENFTKMLVVSASGKNHKLFIIFPKKIAQYRKVQGQL